MSGPTPDGPASAASAASATATVQVDAGEAPLGEAASFWVECTSTGYRACRVQGVVRRVLDIVAEGDDARMHLRHGPPWGTRVRALEVTVERDEAARCVTPIDAELANRATWQRPLPGEQDESTVVVRVFGGRVIAPRLAVGRRLCGFTHTVSQAGLGYPGGWEGELSGDDAAFAAWSAALDRRASPKLAAAWHLSREGGVRRTPIDEGGAFVQHDRVRIAHAGASVVSVEGSEATLSAPDGSFVVAAASDLTEGNTPIFVGHHDTYAFSALRVDPSPPAPRSP